MSTRGEFSTVRMPSPPVTLNHTGCSVSSSSSMSLARQITPEGNVTITRDCSRLALERYSLACHASRYSKAL